MIKSKGFLPLLVLLMLLTGLSLAACGDSAATNTPAAAASASTTVAATTAAMTTSSGSAATTAAAATGSSDGTIPLYAGATAITLPDAVKTQFESSVGSSVVNPQVAAFVTKDDGATVKAFYLDYLTKNGWKDIASAAGASSSLSQIESLGGFYMVYNKDKQVSVLIGLPAAAASGFGVAAADIPASGTLVLGFSGAAK